MARIRRLFATGWNHQHFETDVAFAMEMEVNRTKLLRTPALEFSQAKE